MSYERKSLCMLIQDTDFHGYLCPQGIDDV